MNPVYVILIVMSLGWILFGLISLLAGPVKLKGQGIYAFLIILVLAIPIIDIVLIHFKVVPRLPVFYRLLLFGGGYAIGPLVWLYTNRLHSIKKIPWWIILLHFVPALIYMALFLIPAAGISHTLYPPPPPPPGVPKLPSGQIPPIAPLRPPGEPSLMPLILNFGRFLSTIIYASFAIFSLRNRRKELGDYYSGNTKSVDLKWVSHLNVSLLVLTAISVIGVILSVSLPLPQLGPLSNVIPPLFFVLFFVYYSRFQTVPIDIAQARTEFNQAINDGEALNHESGGDTQSNGKYLRSGLSDEELKSWFKQTQEYIETSKVYLDAELTLEKLASQLGLNRHQLSQTINFSSNTNFYLFINNYRIDAIVDSLKQGEYSSKTLLEIAINHGFNSYPTFFAAFKKIEGISPKDYIARLKSEKKTEND